MKLKSWQKGNELALNNTEKKKRISDEKQLRLGMFFNEKSYKSDWTEILSAKREPLGIVCAKT